MTAAKAKGWDALATGDIFLFEEFRLDGQGDGLSRRDKHGVFVPISIGLRTLDILVVLVERSGGLVTKEEIMAAVWGRTVVENANLTVQISALRRKLDHRRSEEGSCIQTVAARGYRFLPTVTIGKPRRLRGDGSYASIARLGADWVHAAPNIRTLLEATFFAGLRKLGMPEE